MLEYDKNYNFLENSFQEYNKGNSIFIQTRAKTSKFL